MRLAEAAMTSVVVQPRTRAAWPLVNSPIVVRSSETSMTKTRNGAARRPLMTAE